MTNTLQRDASLDLVRLVAFLLLVTCHTCDPFNAAATYGVGEANPDFTFWGAVWGSFVRPCVPLFVMLTGALLLGREKGCGGKVGPDEVGMKHFYQRRIPRVLWPFLIWSCLYYLFPWVLGLLGFGPESVYVFFPWSETDSQTLATALDRIWRIPFQFSYVSCHMWYIYMLIGLYLYLPVFDCWVVRASRREKEYFLLLWAVACFLPYLTNFGTPYSFGTCDWNAYGLFYYFAGFNGYLLLGHYFRRYVKLSMGRALAVAVPLFVAGYLVNLYGYRYVLTLDNPTPQQVELFWTYCTPNVLAMSFALYLVLSRVEIRNERTIRLLANLTRCGFGIYMAHYFLVGPTFELVTSLGTPIALRVPLAGVFVLAESWAFVAFLKRVLPQRAGRILLG